MSATIGFFVLGCVFALAIYASRMAERNGDETLSDVGLAIMEFGRAFPHEAIRSLHATADGRAVFVRLHNNRAGFMRNMRNHYACMLIEPSKVKVKALENARGFHVDFLENAAHSGNYQFKTASEAAEVSLWLLGNYVSPLAMDVPGEASGSLAGKGLSDSEQKA